jgi:phosphate transport system protein
MGHATQAVVQADLALAERVIASRADIAAITPRAEKSLHLGRVAGAGGRGSARGGERYSHRSGCRTHGWAGGARRPKSPAAAIPARVAGGFSENFTDMGAVAVAQAHGASEVLLSRDAEYSSRLAL